MEVFDAAGVTGIIWRRIHPERESEAEAFMRQLMMLCRAYVGYQGSEIFPPIAGVQDAHVVLYRFDSGEHLRAWLAAPERSEILRRMEPLLIEPSVEFFFAHRRRAAGTVSTVFSYRIRPGFEEKFHEWRRRIGEASRVWEGFLGTESFDALDSGKREFVVVVRFDSRAHLDAWMGSEARAALIEEVQAYVEDYQVKRIGTGFEGWFEYGPDRSPPAAWRQGMVVLTALFPLILTLRALLSPVFSVLPFPIAFLTLLVVDVSVLTFFLMPRFSRAMDFWLRPKPGHDWRTEAKGLGILLGVIAATLAVSLMAGR